MEKYIHLTVASDSDVFTVGQFLRSQGHLTKKQISRAKFYPDGIQKNGVRCRITEPVLAGDEIRVCLLYTSLHPHIAVLALRLCFARFNDIEYILLLSICQQVFLTFFNFFYFIFFPVFIS